MSIIFYRQSSLLFSIITITVLGSGLSAKAEIVPASTDASVKLSVASPNQLDAALFTGNSLPTPSNVSSTPAPVPGTTATKAKALTAGLVEPVSGISASKVAQIDNNTTPSPGTGETTPSPDTNTSPGTGETTPSPDTNMSPGTGETTPSPDTNMSPGTGETTPSPDTNMSPGTGETTPSPDTTPANQTPATTSSLSDVDSSYWAYPFIQGLAAKNVIAGFPDGSFRPDQPVTRAQFAAMIQKAFPQTQAARQLPAGGFTDVPANYWATPAIQSAYETGFLSGYPDNTFLPNQEISKVEAITSLTSGLGLTPSGSAADIVTTNYTDAAQVPNYAIGPVAAATQANVVVNYPDVRALTPQTPLTRAEAAAHLYQALVKLGQVEPISSNVAAVSYIVGGAGGVAQTPPTNETTPTTPPTNETPTTTADTTENVPTGIPGYVGGAINIGAIGDRSALGNTNFTVFSKIKLLKSFPLSLRPAVVIGDNSAVLVPVTLDFPLGRPVDVNLFNKRFPLFPYIGGGVIIPTGSGDVGPLITAGIDYRLSPQLTATAGVNVGFVSGDPQLGVLLGIAYNLNIFGGF